MKYLVGFVLFISNLALAGGDGIPVIVQEPVKEQCVPVKKEPCSKPVKKTKPVVKAPVKVVQKKDPCCDAGSDVTSVSKAVTGNQTVNINTAPQQPNTVRVIERIQVRTKRVTKEVNVSNPNRIQILLGASKTKLEVEQDNCCNLKADKVYEFDVGIQYLRDFGGFTGSLMGTMNGSVFVGVGANF